jgi:hypothetical protein
MYDGFLYETFREACQIRGLLKNDNHWDEAMSEAALTDSPKMLRSLFAIILINCAPSNP